MYFMIPLIFLDFYLTYNLTFMITIIFILEPKQINWDLSVSTVARPWASRHDFDSRQGHGLVFPLPQLPDEVWDTPSLLSNGYRGLVPSV